MTIRRMIVTITGWVPQSIKMAVRGNSASPRRFANVIHAVLSRVPGEKFPVLTCAGPLEGFRIKVNWEKHRSFAYGTWEPEVVQAISQSVSPGMTVLDIGAHGGFYTLLLSKLVGPKGRVIAFEPLPANFRLLEENIGLNGVENVVLRREALGEHSGEFDLEVPGDESSLLAGELRDGDERGTTRVPAISLNDFVSRSGLRVDFIKMDVEGAEGPILRGARQTIDAFHPCMMVELHDADRQKELHPAAVQLRESGYQIEWLDEVSYTSHTLARWKAKT